MPKNHSSELSDRIHVCLLYGELYQHSNEFIEFVQSMDSDIDDKVSGIAAYSAICGLAFTRWLNNKRINKKEGSDQQILIEMPVTVEQWNALFEEIRKKVYQDDPRKFNYFARRINGQIVFEDHRIQEEEIDTGFIANLRLVKKIKRVVGFLMDDDPRVKSSSWTLNNIKSVVKIVKSLASLVTPIMFVTAPVALFAAAQWGLPVAIGGCLIAYGIYRFVSHMRHKNDPKPVVEIVSKKDKKLLEEVTRYLTLKKYYQHVLTELQASELAIGMRSIPEHICSIDQELVEHSVRKAHQRRRWVSGLFGKIAVIGLVSLVANAIVSASVTDIAISAASFVGISLSAPAILGIFMGLVGVTLIASTIMAIQQSRKLDKQLSRKEGAELLYHTLLQHNELLKQKNTLLDKRLTEVDARLPKNERSRYVLQVDFNVVKNITEPKQSRVDKGMGYFVSFISGSSKTAKLFRVVLLGSMFGALFTGIPAPALISIAVAAGMVIGLCKVYQSYKKRQSLDDTALIEGLERKNYGLKIENGLLNKRACIRSVQLVDQEEKREILTAVTADELQPISQCAPVNTPRATVSQCAPVNTPRATISQQASPGLAELVTCDELPANRTVPVI